MKLSVLKQLIKEEFLKEIKPISSNGVYVSREASEVYHQNFVDLFNGIKANNKDLIGVRSFIDLGKNVDLYMDNIWGVEDDERDQLGEYPILTMEKGPNKIIIQYQGEMDDTYVCNFYKNNVSINHDVEAYAEDLVRSPHLILFLNTGNFYG